MKDKFWQVKKLESLTHLEWESLCDGCAICCLLKLVDPNSQKVLYTNVACKFLDLETCRCGDYEHRESIVADCLQLTPELLKKIDWLPASCAYRLLAEGKDLPWWHPLVSGTSATVFLAGKSVRGKVVSEDEINLDDLEDMVIDWFD